MSFLTSRLLRSTPRTSISLFRTTTITPANNIRCFHASIRRAALSESDHSEHDHEDRKAKIDEHKDDQLQKQKDGKGHWKKELSSNSESAVKADREEVDDVEEDIDKLQKQTEEAMSKKEGT
ncbi:MAG: hypothetical protein Q9220_002890 [cf. Caloplaca sp. 1 TL-2023]